MRDISRHRARASACVREVKWLSPVSYATQLNSVLCSLKMRKFNIRKVLDGLKEASSSSTPSVQVGPQENHLIQETIQSEHFQLCKVKGACWFYDALVFITVNPACRPISF